MLLVAQDHFEGQIGYDHFAGALLVPQAAALGAALGDLSDVTGEVAERIAALWRLPSTSTDATVYELLVAAASARAGRRVEFLPAGRGGQGVKMPDLRIHDYPFPLVIECKRRQTVTDNDLDEERRMQALFAELRAECRGRGFYGLFRLRLVVDPGSLPVREIVGAAMRQRLAFSPGRYTGYEWGEIAVIPLPSIVHMPPTPLYSPYFLHRVFDWDTDFPAYDGLICQVDRPKHLIVDRARAPIGLAWTNDSPEVFRRRARTAAALFGKAIQQIPAAEMGAVYICYQEGDREAVADDRTRFLRETMRGWTHSANIRVPLIVMSRIVPRPLRHGEPDLVETAIPFISDLTGGSVWLEDLPTTVFTRSMNKGTSEAFLV
jgi:hypothetical protein